MSQTSVKVIRNEVECRDGTVPKTVDTRRHCEVDLRACNNLPQPHPEILVFRGCGSMLSNLLRSAFLYLQFLARCHPYILLCKPSTLPGVDALEVLRVYARL